MQFLLSAASIFLGFLAGENIERLIVGFPSWQHIGILVWAEYSRHADLGNGIFVYPIEAIGSFLLLIAASIIVVQNKPIDKSLSIPVHFASFFAALGLVFTFFAGPFMLS